LAQEHFGPNPHPTPGRLQYLDATRLASIPMDLSEVHQAQIARFASFFKGKREALIRDRQVLNQQFISDYLSDDTAIFNRDNVEGIVSAYQTQAMEGLNEDLEKVTKLAAVYCTELMRTAQAMGMNLQTGDISVVEDQNRIDHVTALSAMQHAPLPAMPKQQLQPLGGSGAGSNDPAMVQQLQDAQEVARKADERFQMMQEQVSSLLKERSSMTSELDSVKANFSVLRSNMAATGADQASQQQVADMELRLHHSQSTIASKNAEVESMRRDYESRLGDSSQFRQLKGIIKEKNNQIKTLRGQLQAAGYAVDGGGAELQADSD